MKRVLFVDDEPNVLQGLRRMLHPLRAEWDMVFAEGGKAAVVELEKQPFDVIVTDMRMPDMDGSRLLTLTHARWPAMVRIVLSGFTELEASMRAIPVAHQFLAKPCDPELLREVIRRACSVQTLLQDESVRRVVGELKTLPSLPRTYAALSRVLADPEASMKEIAAVVERDIGMSAKVLQLVNSSFFGLQRKMASVSQAIAYLGTNMLRNLVLTVDVFQTLPEEKLPAGFSLTTLQDHSLLAANIAARILSDRQLAQDAFTAAMLHDVGELILAVRAPEEFAAARAQAMREGIPPHRVERAHKGVTHAEVGAYLLGLWGLPYPIVEAVAQHHTPARIPQARFDVLGAVYVADLLAREAAQTAGQAVPETSEPPDLPYLAGLGVADQLPEWTRIAAELARGGTS